MKQKEVPEMDDVEEIISKISEESPYKRHPTQKRTWMTVPEMGKLLGLKKTDRYWLVHKNIFESKEIAGKIRINIEKYGILNPLIVRPVPDGYYEIISGHRRKYAAEKLGYRKVPVIIRVLSEDDSILSMVDSNLHRERISYSEKAFAYKLKNDVLKRKSGRKKSQVDHKKPRKRSIDIISEDCGDSPKQVQRYISLRKQ